MGYWIPKTRDDTLVRRLQGDAFEPVDRRVPRLLKRAQHLDLVLVAESLEVFLGFERGTTPAEDRDLPPLGSPRAANGGVGAAAAALARWRLAARRRQREPGWRRCRLTGGLRENSPELVS